MSITLKLYLRDGHTANTFWGKKTSYQTINRSVSSIQPQKLLCCILMMKKNVSELSKVLSIMQRSPQ